ncbi:hypothetical protein [Geodermatophilus amargosae]|uniref:hypothetical protein n=1 Tax=Geodermatophilus amargosae TaxID=1296565 RepID=UPI0015872477|nr:hypothetical protein [Geodermatophilus amargosae]
MSCTDTGEQRLLYTDEDATSVVISVLGLQLENLQDEDVSAALTPILSWGDR